MNRTLPHILISAIDGLIVVASVFMAYLLRFNFAIPGIELVEVPLVLLVMVPVRLALFAATRSYLGIVRYSGLSDSFRMVLVLIAGSFLFILADFISYYFINQRLFIPLTIIILEFLITTVMVFFFRAIISGSHSPKKVIRKPDSGVTAKNDRSPAYNGKSDHKLYHTGKPATTHDQPLSQRYAGTDQPAATPKFSTGPPAGEVQEGMTLPAEKKELFSKTFSGRKIMITGAGGSSGAELVRLLLHFNPSALILADRSDKALHDLEQMAGSWQQAHISAATTGNHQIYWTNRNDGPIANADAGNNQIFPADGDHGVFVKPGSDRPTIIGNGTNTAVNPVDQSGSAWSDQHCNISYILADVTREREMETIFASHRPQIVIHAAMLNNGALLEDHPREALRVNIGGTCVVATQAAKHDVERFILVSPGGTAGDDPVSGISPDHAGTHHSGGAALAEKQNGDMLRNAETHAGKHESGVHDNQDSIPGKLISEVFENPDPVAGNLNREVMINSSRIAETIITTFPEGAGRLQDGVFITIRRPQAHESIDPLGNSLVTARAFSQLIAEALATGQNGEIFEAVMREQTSKTDQARRIIRQSGLHLSGEPGESSEPASPIHSRTEPALVRVSPPASPAAHPEPGFLKAVVKLCDQSDLMTDEEIRNALRNIAKT